MALEGRNIGHYQLLRLLGAGGMGEVYLADDNYVKRQVAVKVMRTQISGQIADEKAETALKLFQREATAIARMQHPRILTLHEYAEDWIDGRQMSYMVMPYCAEGSLEAWLSKRGTHQPLSAIDVVHFINQASEALQNAHNEQIIHQDVKPDNFLLLNSKGNRSSLPDLLLADFGIARLMSASGSTTNSVRGTILYMAPEQLKGEPTLATDQYALAIMTYRMLTGYHPFEGATNPLQLMHCHASVTPEPPSKLNPRLSREIDAVIRRGLAKAPADRFPRVSDFADALQRAIEHPLTTAQPAFPGPAAHPHGLNPQTPAIAITQVDPAKYPTRLQPAAPPRPDISAPGPQEQGLVRDPFYLGGVRPTIPVIREQAGAQKQKRDPFLISIAAVTVLLILIGILTSLNASFQGFFFGAAVVWSFALTGICGQVFGRWVGIPALLVLAQLVLLTGYGYNHFGWRPGVATPIFALSAGFEAIFWIILVIETLATIGMVLYNATR